QSDVSVYRNLLFVSGEGFGGRLDCGSQGVHDSVSHERLRGIRIFDITDISSPKYLANVQTCRGSHTHTVVIDPKDTDNVYVYVSGSAPVRSPTELPGCVRQSPDSNPNSSLFRIEVIKVPLAAPQSAAIVSSPRIFDSLAPAPQHGEMAQDVAEAARVADSAAHGSQPVPRHHRLSGHWSRRRRVRRLRIATGHSGRRASAAHRGGVRLELLVLAFGDVQQRRHQGALHRRVGRRRAAQVPR